MSEEEAWKTLFLHRGFPFTLVFSDKITNETLHEIVVEEAGVIEIPKSLRLRLIGCNVKAVYPNGRKVKG